MNKITILGVVRHGLTFLGGLLVTQGLASDGEVAELAGALCTVIGVVWSIYEKRQALRGTATTATTTTGSSGGTNVLQRLPMWLMLLQVACVFGFAVWITGCVALKPGADPLVVRAEQVQASAAATFDLVLRANQANREWWRVEAPRFHEFCEWLRAPVLYASPEYGPTNISRVLVMQLQVDDLKGDYKSAKTVTRSNALWTALITLESAVNKAAAWQTLTE